MTQPGRASCVCLGKLAMGTNVRSSAVSASGRYRLLVSTPRNTISPAWGSGARVHKDLAQLLGIDLAVFQSFVQAGPGPLKKRRERQFGETARSCFTGERIHQIEQGV